MVAAVQEYGGTINIPAHTVDVFRKVLKNGSFAKNGRFVKRKSSNFMTSHMVNSYEITIPSRPFFRNMLAALPPELNKFVVGALKQEKYSTEQVVILIGAFVKGKLQDSIRDFTEPPNAPSTIRRKGFNNPLIDTGHMMNSVDFEVEEA